MRFSQQKKVSNAKTFRSEIDLTAFLLCLGNAACLTETQKISSANVIAECKDHWIIIGFRTEARNLNPAILSLYKLPKL